MIVLTKTTVTFLIPNDHKQLDLFIKKNDMSEWKECVAANYVSYSRSQNVVVCFPEEYLEGDEWKTISHITAKKEE